MKKFTDKPVYSLQVHGGGCPFTIMVNDIPVYMQYDFDEVRYTQPINQFITNGSNNISVQVSYAVDEKENIIKDKKCSVGVSYIVSESGSDKHYVLGDLVYNATSGTMLNNPDPDFIKGSTAKKLLAVNDGKLNEVDSTDAEFYIGQPKLTADDTSYYAFDFDTHKVQKQAGAAVSNTLGVWLPYENQALTEGEVLANNEETKEQLIVIYKTIYNSILKNDFTKLRSLFEPIIKNKSVSLYLPENKTNVLKYIQETSQSGDYELVHGDDFSDVVLNVFGHNKLATLTWWDNSSIFAFNRSKGSGSRTYNLVFAKINGKWKVVL